MTQQIEDGLVQIIKSEIEKAKLDGTVPIKPKSRNNVDWTNYDTFQKIFEIIFENYQFNFEDHNYKFNKTDNISSKINYFRAFFSHIGSLKSFFKSLGLNNLIQSDVTTPIDYLEDRTFTSIFCAFQPQVFGTQSDNQLPPWIIPNHNYFNTDEKYFDAFIFCLQMDFGYNQKDGRFKRANAIKKFLNQDGLKKDYFIKNGLPNPYSRGTTPNNIISKLDSEAWGVLQSLNSTNFGIYWNDEIKARERIDAIFQKNLGYDPNGDEKQQLASLEMLFSWKGGIAGALDEFGIRRTLIKQDYHQKNGIPGLFSWYLKDSPQVLELFLERYGSNENVGKNGINFEQAVIEQDVLSYFFPGPKYHIGSESGNCLIDANGIRRDPDAVLGDFVYQVSMKKGKVNKERVYVPAIIDIKRGLDGVRLGRTNSEDQYVVGDIEKYAALCDDYVLFIGEYYNPDTHDEKLGKIVQEFENTIQKENLLTEEPKNKRLYIIFADSAIQMLKNADLIDAAEKYDEAVRHHWKKAYNITEEQLPVPAAINNYLPLVQVFGQFEKVPTVMGDSGQVAGSLFAYALSTQLIVANESIPVVA